MKKIDTWIDVQRFVKEAYESAPHAEGGAGHDEQETLVAEYDVE